MAKKAVKDNTSGASSQSYSFMQVSSDSANVQVVRMIKNLARKQPAPELAQLASRLGSVIRLGELDKICDAILNHLNGNLLAKMSRTNPRSSSTIR